MKCIRLFVTFWACACSAVWLQMRVRIKSTRPTAVRIKSTRPTAVAYTWKVIAPHIRWQRNIAVRACADQVRRSVQVVELRRPERLGDLGTSFRGPAAVEQSGFIVDRR